MCQINRLWNIAISNSSWGFNKRIFKRVEKTDLTKVTDEYWKRLYKFWGQLSEDNKEIFSEIIKQVQVDTVAQILGVLDGVSPLGEDFVDIHMKVEGNEEVLNGDLLDSLLEYVEEQE